MTKLEELTVEVKYRVSYLEVEMPDEVYNQLLEASEKGHSIDMDRPDRYTEALVWLNDNIKEADATDWEAEIEEIIDINDEG